MGCHAPGGELRNTAQVADIGADITKGFRTHASNQFANFGKKEPVASHLN